MEEGGSSGGKGTYEEGRALRERDRGKGIFEREVLKLKSFDKLGVICDFNKFLLSTHKRHTKVSVVNEG